MDRNQLPDQLTANQCAQLAGVSPRTWNTYTSRTTSTTPRHTGYHPDSGEKLWDTAQVLRWLDQRPGPGYRTDLHTTR